jgi:hypothetical protein
MIPAQTRSAFVARENRYPLFRIMSNRAGLTSWYVWSLLMKIFEPENDELILAHVMLFREPF